MTHLLYVWPVEKQLFGLWDWPDWYYPIFPMMNFPRGSPWLFRDFPAMFDYPIMFPSKISENITISIHLYPQWNPMNSWENPSSKPLFPTWIPIPQMGPRAGPCGVPHGSVAGAGAVHRVSGSVVEVEPLRSGGNVSMDLRPTGESLGSVGVEWRGGEGWTFCKIFFGEIPKNHPSHFYDLKISPWWLGASHFRKHTVLSVETSNWIELGFHGDLWFFKMDLSSPVFRRVQ